MKTASKKNEVGLRSRDLLQGPNKRAALVLSVASIVVFVAVSNRILSQTGLENQDLGLRTSARSIASIPQREMTRESLKKEIEWEHDIAFRMALGEGLTQTSLGEKPSSDEEFIFGTLRGQYGVKMNSGKIMALEFNDIEGTQSNTLSEPYHASDWSKFLLDHERHFAKRYSSLKLLSKEDGTEVYELFLKNQVVGQVKLSKDSQGRLLSLVFENSIR